MVIATEVPLSPADLIRYGEASGIEFAHGRLWEKPVSSESAEVEATIVGLLSV